eukprot:768678-Hanusia_phi.AAC.1
MFSGLLKPPINSRMVASARSKVHERPKPNCSKVISYSLWGQNRRYLDGALENIKLAQLIFPGWCVRFYVDSSVPRDVLQNISVEHVQIFDTEPFRNITENKMSWRFLVASDSSVERYVVRDVDSRLSLREKTAVDEWILSGKRFHVMRDHPSHARYQVSGGMWGGTKDSVPELIHLLRSSRAKMDDSYLKDMDFLNQILWPKMQYSVLQHDSFSCLRYGARSFPSKRQGWRFVGEVYLNNMPRQSDVQIIQRAAQPKECFDRSSLFDPPPPRNHRVQLNEPSTVILRVFDEGEFNWETYRNLVSQCPKLNSEIFLECKYSWKDLPLYQPCTKYSYIARISNAFVSDNRIHSDVPGTVFTDHAWYQLQEYVRNVPEGDPVEWKPAPQIHNFSQTCLATLLQPYGDAKGHFPHEVLPRLIFLAANLPESCFYLMKVNEFVSRYLSILPANISSRVLAWQGFGHVYFSQNVYVASEGPFCHWRNPHRGGISTWYHYSTLSFVRSFFKPSNCSKLDVLIRNHEVIVFDGSGTLQKHIDLFHNARTVVGPHGAGFANLVFAKSGTGVIELGWDSKNVMEMDNMFARLSAALKLEYRLCVGQGSYGGPISFPADELFHKYTALAKLSLAESSRDASEAFEHIQHFN